MNTVYMQKMLGMPSVAELCHAHLQIRDRVRQQLRLDQWMV